MLNKEVYAEYLASTRRNEKAVNENMDQLERFQQFVNENGYENLSNFSRIIYEYIKPEKPVNRAGEIEKANKFMIDYAVSIEKGFVSADEQGCKHIAAEIRNYYKKLFENNTINHVILCKEKFLPILNDFEVNPLLLQGLTNEQFVAAFKALHRLMHDIYDDIKKSPFSWGYPDFLTTEGYYGRVVDILISLFSYGTYKDGCIIVDAKKFFAEKRVKTHKKIELMIDGFTRMGFKIDGYDKKAAEFQVSYPPLPHIINVLSAYVPIAFDMTIPVWSAKNRLAEGFSYRFVENPKVQEFEADYHAYMDHFSEKYAEIQRWLRSEAAKYGFFVPPNNVTHKGCVSYKKGSKQFLLVGEKEGKIWTKTSFIKAFEDAPEKMRKLCDRFPHVFKLENAGKCCHENKCMFRMKFSFDGVSYLRCGLENFVFNDLNIDDVKAILDLFKIENKIRR